MTVLRNVITRSIAPHATTPPTTDIDAAAAQGARGCLFTFHRAAPTAIWEGLPNRGFHLDLGFLDRLLTHLARRGWEVVTVEEACRRARTGAGRHYVNFSIDDCYRDTYEQVVPLFRRHRVPVTLFVTTGIPDGTLPLWAAGLEDVLTNRDVVVLPDGDVTAKTPAEKRAAFDRIARVWDGPDAAAHYDRFCAANGVDRAAMHSKHAISWQMLRELAADPLVEIGAHTVSHARIASLTPAEATTELAGSRERLMHELGLPVRHFAFPYGRAADCGARDFDLARAAGFASAATTRKGLVRRGQDVFSLPRNTINGGHRSLLTMQLHLSGIGGALAKALGRV